MADFQVKATLLGALFLIDYMYFEESENKNRDTAMDLGAAIM